jgi:hypothetical protein
METKPFNPSSFVHNADRLDKKYCGAAEKKLIAFIQASNFSERWTDQKEI